MVTDIRMPPTGTDEGIRRRGVWLRENRPKVGVVVLSQYTAPAYARSPCSKTVRPGRAVSVERSASPARARLSRAIRTSSPKVAPSSIRSSSMNW